MSALDRFRRAALRLSGAALRRQQRLHDRLERGFRQRSARPSYLLRNEPSSAERLIVHCNGNFSVGGSTQLIVDLIELSSDAYRHEVVVPARPDPLPYRPVDLHGFALDRMEDLRAFLAERQPALVHVHYWSRAENRFDATGIWYAAVLAICEELDLPVVQNVNVPTHAMPGEQVRRNVFVSDYVRDHYDTGAAPAERIYPGSDFTHFRRAGEAGAPDTIGMVYRLDGDKLTERSIEPFIRVCKARPATRALIVGEGLFSNLYRERVRQEGLGDRIEFAGMVPYDALPALYERMGVFVAPVHNESFGQVTPFAMSMALPVAGYAVGALPEILGTGDTLAPPGDEESLAGVILGLLDDPDRRLALGRANLDRAHALFSREAMVSRYRALYAELLSTGAADAA